MYSHKSAQYAAGREPHVNISAMIVIGTPTPAANHAMRTIKPITLRNLRGWGAAWLVVLACAACSAPAPASGPSPTAQPETTTAPAAPTESAPAQPTASAIAACTDDADFVSDVTVPDFSLVAPGAVLDKQWQISNSGTCAWGPQHRVIFVEGNALGATLEHALYPALPGTLAVVNIPMVAPAAAGEYEGYWRLSAANGEAFGSRLYIKITVATPAP